MKQKSVAQHNFGAVPVSRMPRSIFDRSFGHSTCIDCDYLYPIMTDHILPGDSIQVKMNVLVRTLSATLKPLMDNVTGSMYTFFVPYRLLWANFRKHMGEQDSPGDSISYNMPTVPTPNGASGGVPIGNLYDYLGVPTEASGMGGAGVASQSINNMLGRAYNKIFFDHFKDQNLQNTPVITTGDGPDTFTDYVLLKVGKKFNYFTSCLPYPQKGATAVDLPLGTSAPVLGISKATQTFPQSSVAGYDSGGNNPTYTYAAYLNYGASVNNEFSVDGTAASGGYPNIYADLSSATAATINSLRQSITLQQFLERDARSGTRYVEIVKSHFAGVIVPDFRAQRSEIIHINNFSINFNPVAQTSASGLTGGSTYQGDLTAFGTGAQTGETYTHSFTEHGVLMTLLVIRGEQKFSQGLDRFWSKSTRYDHYWPILAHLGEQEIYNKEIYWNLADGTASNQKDGVFGYLPRFDEYRTKNSQLSSLMRPHVTGTLAIWNLSELFSSQPTLGNTFIQSNTPMDRAVAVPSAPHFMVDAYFKVKHARIMPVFAVPGLRRL